MFDFGVPFPFEHDRVGSSCFSGFPDFEFEGGCWVSGLVGDGGDVVTVFTEPPVGLFPVFEVVFLC